MKTTHVIRIKNTKEVLFNGIDLDDCKKVMKPAFFNHIDKGLGLEDFPLEAVTIHELEEEFTEIMKYHIKLIEFFSASVDLEKAFYCGK